MKLAFALTFAMAFFARVQTTPAAEITLGASGPMREALSLLMPDFERKSGHRVKILYASDNEARAATARGEDVDVAIIAPPFDAVIASGKALNDSRAEIARVRVGFAVRSRDPKPDVSTLEALKRALLASPRIVYPDAGGSTAGAIFERVIDRLGIAADLAPKLRRVRGGPAAMVALPREEADLGVAFISEIMPEPGIDLLGGVPAALDPGAVFSGFVLARSKEAQAGRDLLTFLASGENARVYATAGMAGMR